MWKMSATRTTSNAGANSAIITKTFPSPRATFPTTRSVTTTWTTTVAGDLCRNTARFGSPIWPWLAGRRITTDIGHTSCLGATPGLTMRLGVSRPFTMDAGSQSEEPGAGFLAHRVLSPMAVPCTFVRFTRRRWWRGWAGHTSELALLLAAVGGGVGWFPLGPREVYVPSYPVSRTYVNRVNVSNTTVNTTVVNNYYTNVVVNKNVNITNVTYVNQRVPGAVAATTPQAFSSGQPIAKNAVPVDPREVASAPVNAITPAAVPQREAVQGGRAPSSVKPPAAVQARAVVAKTAPPSPPPSFAQHQAAIQSNGGRPISVAQVRQLAPVRQQAAVAPKIKVAPPSKPAMPQTVRGNKTPSRRTSQTKTMRIIPKYTTGRQCKPPRPAAANAQPQNTAEGRLRSHPRIVTTNRRRRARQPRIR